MHGLLLALAPLTLMAADHLVYPLPPESSVSVQRDMPYHDNLRFDLYRPANATGPLPVVVFLAGAGSNNPKRWPQYTGWASLVTTAGVAGIVFDEQEGKVPESTEALLAYLREHAADLHLDAGNVVLWSCSSNASKGVPFAMDPRHAAIKAAVIYYGAGDRDDLRIDIPVFLARAGLDGVDLNRAIDRFVARATAANAPLTFVNLPSAHHAFDVRDDNDASRDAIARTLEFIRTQTAPGIQRHVREGVSEASAASAVYRGDSAEAMKQYEALAAARPSDTEVHRNFGNALFAAGQYRRALAEFERALALGNFNVGWISYSAAQASFRLGDREAAFKSLANLKDIGVMRSRLRDDSEFAPLRDDPRFQAVVADRLQ